MRLLYVNGQDTATDECTVCCCRCLTECGWDFNRAAQAFTMAKEKGQIPPEAFVK